MSSQAPTLIARVEPLTTTRAIRGPFDYRLAPDQLGVQVGSLLRVPFGSRTTLGVVTELAGESAVAPERLVEPEAVLSGGLPEDLVALASWMAEQYCSTPARALGLLLGPGAGDRVRAKQVLVAELTGAGREALLSEARLTDRQRAALESLERDGATVAGELGTETLRRLERRGLVELRRSVRRRRPRSVSLGARLSGPPTLTVEQTRALEEIHPALAAPGDGARFLLHGVTGSGKTEIYLRAVQATLAVGRSAIVLVPEIALTPQVTSRFQDRFGDVVAVLHSALSKGERRDEWVRLRSGEARVCVGPRSAVFAPLADIGLIVWTRSTTPPTSTRATLATTPGQWRRSGRAGTAPSFWLAAPLHVPRASSRSAPAPAHAGRRPPPAAGRGARHAGPPPPAAPSDQDGPIRPAPGRGEGDRAAQPARMVELPLLPRLRPGLDVPQL